MGKRARYYLASMYGALLLIGCAGYFLAPKIVLIVALAIGGAVGAALLEKAYGVVVKGVLNEQPRLTQAGWLIALAVLSIAGALVLYATSGEVGPTGFFLGIGIYCLQSLLLRSPP
ncbi:hypothetical protein [Pseudoduganella buxea]|uniref:DUF2178 domain-containing protein n=1 Tax=Pseudoduganella buxea TaxID=1949069 RepID=A0ABQ1L096_9BURK|nr:hypothetical protein [Pseudoduganella buxea]GGC14274.1 hypothetical protein GCM10011572_39660 [Pseudoduganella buxea]